MSSDQQKADGEKKSGTYEGGCHCGYIKFSVTLSPPLPEHKVLNCNCSSCSHFGYLLVYPKATDVVWHNNGRERCASYRFNTKQKDQMFCPKCGASLGIDFEKWWPDHTYGISVSTPHRKQGGEMARGSERLEKWSAEKTSNPLWLTG
ncbi:Mss4-like protein [Hypoxylon sp. FL0890]|nr:Mss4-like protein [Hypoxylon sp. FL0890]